MQALLSVYNKSGVVDFGKILAQAGFKIISTGGTSKSLVDAGVPVVQVSDITEYPEMLDGRVKTLHPRVHGALLARTDLPEHQADLAKHNINPIQLVAVNLYPFVETISKPSTTLADALENVDIGGHTLIRASSKNFKHVIIVVDPNDYKWIGERIQKSGVDSITLEERSKLALKAFQHGAQYDAAVSQYLSTVSLEGGKTLETATGDKTVEFPQTFVPLYEKKNDLRYGENPHQKAALYSLPGVGGIANAELLHGPALSYNNILDGDAALKAVREFSGTACCVIKHTNPCGLAMHENQAEAYVRAFNGDPKSAYGGILGFNRTLTLDAAKALKSVFYEVIIAPDYEKEALELLSKKEKLRILRIPEAATQAAFAQPDVRTITGGALLQQPNPIIIGGVDEACKNWKVVTKVAPTAEQMRDLLFAWRVSKHVKSNAIVVAHDNQIVAIGAGQPNRVQSLHICVRVGGDKVKGSVLASDAFFPFADSIDAAHEAQVSCIVQPGGSIRDQEVIDAADKFGIPMVFTGNRNFLH
ncbi:AICAR transformylase / IMP cyclohydrolase [Heterostelium album PN500]|uniref:AICAR transformylase / IMP cyclohydrolase n=1 Tax=Heterostelium pallidum (strain ATCC 26659 / Pp 5 / PN500) TaxID=670386 RepID=D3BI88_HETP5|nr:AICAR transformylase / IMP cyclohydrolase [Heterostelium album PN500]EFA78988.1 AICAR transformylase / IMP cyclohydrolase [Heterostelium album PN500]|eukprot:XP_020431112.1 AICAR transformylase / IMP cyclohydrolase [Heterostelium album PN500]